MTTRNPAGPVVVRVPSMLRAYCAGASEVPVEPGTVAGALLELERRHPALYGCVCDETGAVRRHVNLFVNTSHVRDLAGLSSPLAPGDELYVLPAVSGG